MYRQLGESVEIEGTHSTSLRRQGDAVHPAGTAVATHLRQYGDSAFKKEEDTGHSMRGAFFIRAFEDTQEHMITTQWGHLLDYVARSQRRVTRATFTAELLGACDTQDRGLLLAQQLHEIAGGVTTAAAGKQLREDGGYLIPMALYIDALSVYAAITATFVKTPADNGALCHLLYLRELLDHGVLHALIWVDTRDMLADGLTKGSIDRTLIHSLMEGSVISTHEMKCWRPKRLSAQGPGPSA